MVLGEKGGGAILRDRRVEIVRELTEKDLLLLELDRGVKAPTLRRLTDMHHNIARLVAQGEAGYGISMATGYSESRISILKGDPAFQELVAHYREDLKEIKDTHTIDVIKKGAALYCDVLDYLHAGLLDGTYTDARDIVDIGKFAGDRSGFGPASKQDSTNLNVTLLADTLAAGRLRAVELEASVPAAQANKSTVAIAPPPKDRRDE